MKLNEAINEAFHYPFQDERVLYRKSDVKHYMPVFTKKILEANYSVNPDEDYEIYSNMMSFEEYVDERFKSFTDCCFMHSILHCTKINVTWSLDDLIADDWIESSKEDLWQEYIKIYGVKK